MRWRAVLPSTGFVLATSTVLASEPADVLVTVRGPERLRVQLAEGLAMPCDSTSNHPLFDGTVAPGESFRTQIAGDCVCERHTVSPFREVDWTTSALRCRPRVCRANVCRPAPDPTIRLTLP